MSVLKRLFADRRPPADAARPLARDERVLAWAAAEGGGTVLATQLGLWLPGPDGSERIGWHLVDKVIWRGGTLTVIAAEDTGGGMLAELPPRSVRLAEPRDLPPTVRARVERSIGYTRHHKLAPGGGVRVVGRRVAGRDGLTWQLVFDPGTDRDDPLLRVQAEELVAAARVETGSPR
ncbi:MAG: hypothetical protein V7637_3337 [Mycobacteriales bacterium]